MLTADDPIPLKTAGNDKFERLADYLRENIKGLGSDLSFFRFPGGYSNLTYLVSDGKKEFVLKSAPPGNKSKGAHDMGREFHIVAHLQGAYPYLPRAILFCEDAVVFGERFCVMERLKGVIIRRQFEKCDIARDLPSKQFERLIDALAELHSIKREAVGLADFGHPAGYRRRQLEGWEHRLDAAKTDDMPDFRDIRAWLSSYSHSDEERAAVIHNDFKLDNLMWSDANHAELVAVLDWEMATVGNPLIDLACTLSFWAEPTDPPEFLKLRSMPSATGGVMSRRDAAKRYAEKAQCRVTDLAYYVGFGLFRRAAIEQQKYARFVRGDSGDSRFADLNHAVGVLRDMCECVIDGRIAT